MCGGTLDVQEGMTVCECEYCGSKQTIPSLDNEKKTNLFNRANRLRFNNEFDKASGIYETIVSEFPEEAEAYWGLLLCKYGIEYVDDPLTSKKIPTCHRANYTSIFDDENFELCLEYSDSLSKEVYRNEAKEIDRIQESILDVASKEEPFDVFICYKETDENGNRTKDSVLAQDIYDKLTEKGYKVFFSRITLEDKLGQEYEPYIFSALNSAKVMLAVGTKYEYYDSVWVKNEWSRFLDLMKSNKDKVLIPCYADIDAYDLPREFKNLQGQDMNKLGFIQDLIRGVEKLVNSHITDNKNRYENKKDIYESLIINAKEMIKNEKYDSAEEICYEILKINPQSYDAYMCLLLSEFRIKNLDDIDLKKFKLDENKNFIRALMYAANNDEIILRNILSKNLENIKEEEDKYSKAKELLLSNNINDLNIAKSLLTECDDYKDSKDLVLNAQKRIRIYKKKKARTLTFIGILILVLISFALTIYVKKIYPEKQYKEAVELYEAKKFIEAETIFQKISEYNDSIIYLHKINVITSLSNSNEGDIVLVGKYEIDNNFTNGSEDIPWIVVKKDKYDYYLVSKYILDYKMYGEDVWDNCSLRDWLNRNFYKEAFNEGEKELIVSEKVAGDFVRIMNHEEVMSLLSERQRKAEVTEYCKNLSIYQKYNYKNDYSNLNGGNWWWIMDYHPFTGPEYIDGEGLNKTGMDGGSEAGIRPYIKIEIG